MKTFNNIMQIISLVLGMVIVAVHSIGIIGIQEATYAIVLMTWIYITNENHSIEKDIYLEPLLEDCIKK